jgi:transposase
MTPDDETTFITYWQQGLETAEIAQRLGVTLKSAQSRVYRLRRQGKIQPRPLGCRRRPVMAQWEYMHERIEQPLGGSRRDVRTEAMVEMNRLGADGWEVCSVLADEQAWIVLLKREIPGLGIGGAGGPGGSGGSA